MGCGADLGAASHTGGDTSLSAIPRGSEASCGSNEEENPPLRATKEHEFAEGMIGTYRA